MIVEFNGQTFKTKAALFEFIKERINALPNGFADPDTRRFLAALIQRHPDRDTKLARGLVDFFIQPNGPKGKRLFLQDGSGTLIPFSWKKCATGLPQTDKSRMTRAMREAIREQLDAYKASAADDHCTLCGGTNATEVDHTPPLYKLRDDFLAVTEIKSDPIVDLAHGGVDLCDDIKQAWLAYHALYAGLRMACRDCNQKSWRIDG